MIHATKGIVLRSVKYGETSVVATIFTEIFGIQSYIVNGVRTAAKTSKAHFFQPSSLLDLQVYHNELKNLQRIKEMKWAVLYKNILSDVPKNSVALFMVELLFKTLKQPEINADLFYFCEDAFLELDAAGNEVTANFPIYFALQLIPFLGFQLLDNYSEYNHIFNISDGEFSNMEGASAIHLSKENSCYISELLKARRPIELQEIKMNRTIRRSLLKDIESYYSWHLPDFGSLKTLPVLHEIL